MRFGSACSGVEAASLAFCPPPLNWECAFVAENEPAPSAVIAHRFPGVRNMGDVTRFKDWPLDVAARLDLLIAGTPCQSLSNAGLRKGLEDPRGALMLVFGGMAARFRPPWIVWENVPGVLSNDAGRSFATFLGMLSGQSIEPPSDGWQNSGVIAPGTPHAYGLAWAMLDAQYFGLAQRRARVFVVGYLGDWRPPAAVLLEPESMRGDPPPRRGAGQSVAGTFGGSAQSGGFRTTDLDNHGAYIVNGEPVPPEPFAFKASHYTRDKDGAPSEIAPALSADADRGDQDTLVMAPAYGISSDALDRSGEGAAGNAAERAGLGVVADLSPASKSAHPNAVAYAIQAGAVKASASVNASRNTTGPDGLGVAEDLAYALEARAEQQVVAFDTTQITQPTNRSNPEPGDPCFTLAASAKPPVLAFGGNNTAGPIDVATAQRAHGGTGHGDFESETFLVEPITLAVRGRGDGRRLETRADGLANALVSSDGGRDGMGVGAVAFNARQDPDVYGDQAGPLDTDGSSIGVHTEFVVRRLTPLEGERLQGMPDGHTLVPYRNGKPMADSPRYKAIGNSFPVPVIQWIGMRIALVDAEMKK